MLVGMRDQINDRHHTRPCVSVGCPWQSGVRSRIAVRTVAAFAWQIRGNTVIYRRPREHDDDQLQIVPKILQSNTVQKASKLKLAYHHNTFLVVDKPITLSALSYSIHRAFVALSHPFTDQRSVIGPRPIQYVVAVRVKPKMESSKEAVWFVWVA
jgi:hypothetical protein